MSLSAILSPLRAAARRPGSLILPSMTSSKGQLPSLVCNAALRPISTSCVLLAEPLKKKKRMDPAILRAREARRQRKLEKQIRRLLKNARQLKPIDECQVPICIVDKPRERARRLPQLSTEEVENRWVLQRDMSKFKFEQVSRELRVIDLYLKCQEKALTELRKESEDLYTAAIEFDSTYLPYQTVGPVETPPIKGYKPAEGDYFDISKKWDKQQ